MTAYGLTPRQSELMTFLATYDRDHGYAPTFDEMRNHLGLRSKSSIDRLLNALEERGQPLMPRYLFVGLPKMNMDFYKLCNCDGVEGILGADGRPLRVSGGDVEAIYIAEIGMDFDDTRAARIHRQEEAASEKENTARRFLSGRWVIVDEPRNPFVEFSGIVEEVTKAGRVIALIELFGRMIPVEFDAEQLKPDAAPQALA